MTVQVLILVGVVALLSLMAAIGYYLVEQNRDRRRWATYSDYRGGEPKAVVCASCRTRNYSLRAIREQRCMHCGADWTDAGRSDRAA